MYIKAKKLLCVFLATFMLFSTISVAFAADDEIECPLKVEITTDRSKYGTIGVAKFNVEITNISDEAVENISAEAIFDKLAPLGSKSQITAETDELAAGESIEFSFKATLNIDNNNLNIFQKFFLKLTRMFFKNIPVVDNGFVDNRYFFDTVKDITFGSIGITEIIRVWFGEELDPVDRLVMFNGGVEPEVTMDEDDGIPSFIDGKFTNRTVLNENDAVNSLNDIAEIMGIDNANEEFQAYQKDEYEDHTYYRMQQMCGGVEVYGKNMIVSVDESGQVTALSGNYEPRININTTPVINESLAVLKTKELLNSYNSITPVKLVIYTFDYTEVLAWQIKVNGVLDGSFVMGNLFLSAIDGTQLSFESDLRQESVTASVSSPDGLPDCFPDVEKININVWKDSATSYIMYDSINNIEVYDVNRDILLYYTDPISSYNDSKNLKKVTSTTLTQWDDDAVIYLYSLEKIYDYFQENFGRNGFDNANGKVFAVYNDAIIRLDEQNNIVSRNGENCYSFSEAGSGSTVISMGYNYGTSTFDVLCHEYMHSVEGNISDMRYSGESGALMEAYSDIMGEIIQQDSSWKHHSSRNLADTGNNPSCYKGDNWVNTSNPNDNNDYGGVHTNCTVVGHAAYLMYKSNNISWDELGELWFRSVYYLNSTSTFLNCRAAVIAAARDMGLSNTKIECIRDKFDEVGITNNDTTFFGFGKIVGTVKSANAGNPIIPGAQVIALKTAPNGWGAGIVETDSNGIFEIPSLSVGVYQLTVTAPGYRQRIVSNVVVTPFETTYLDNSILLDSSLLYTGAVGGKITNALTNAAVPNATLKFRENHGVTSGNYFMQNGSVLTLTTDSYGKYQCDNIPTGYYTMEVTCSNFITGYYNIIASPSSSICLNQNFSITPVLPEGQYRIVLTWGSNPRDLDSHITGTLTNGSDFHVFYSNKNAYDGDINVANLDVDDTSSYGPETVTLNPTTTGTYRYFIYNFSGNSGGTIAASGAQIKLYKGNTLLATYNTPTDQGEGRYWTVFEITNGVVKNVNKMGDGVYTETSTEYSASDNFEKEYFMQPKSAS